MQPGYFQALDEELAYPPLDEDQVDDQAEDDVTPIEPERDDPTERKLAELEQRLAQRDFAERQQQISSYAADLDAKRARLDQEWIAATEEGRTTDVARLNREINKLDFDIRSARTVADAERAQAQQQPAAQIEPKLRRFAEVVGYQAWEDDEKQIAAGIDLKLAKSIPRSDPRFVPELARRVAAAIPERAEAIRAASASAGQRTGRMGSARLNEPVRIGATDEQQMKAFGLDPNSKAVRQHWGASKQRLGYR